MEQPNVKKSKVGLYTFLIRAWSAGAIFFFIAWGTSAGANSDVLDLVMLLGIAVGIFFSFVVNPVLKSLYNVGNQKTYIEMTVAQRIILRFKDVGIALLISIIIALIYQGINTGAILLFDLPAEKVSLPAEPILFGLLYAGILTLLIKGYTKFKKKATKDEIHK